MAKKRKKPESRNVNPARKKDKLLHVMPSYYTEERIKDKKFLQVILEFAEPLMQKCKNVPQQKKLIVLAMIAWNMSCLSEKEKEQSKEEAGRTLWGDDLEDQLFMKNVFDYFLERKDKYFSHEKRIVSDYEIREYNDRLDLTVFYSSPKVDKD